MIRIIGSYLSPYVRKVLVCLELKEIPYEIDPIVPFYGNDEFSVISPVRRIPVLMDDAVVLPDSTVICEYLEDRFPSPSLLPAEPAARANARWLDEYAGSRMGEVFIWRYFNQLVIRRYVWGEQTDERIVQHSREVEIPSILEYLESTLPDHGFLFGQIGVADISIACFFRNIELTRTQIDFSFFPKTERFVSTVLNHPAFLKLRVFEDLSATTPIAAQRDALRSAGAPISAETFFSDKPRRGVLNI